MAKQTNLGDINVPIAAIVNKYLANWYYFAGSLVLCMSIAYVIFKTTPPAYEVKSVLLLDDNSAQNNNSEEFMKEMGLFMSKTKIDDEIGFLTSYPILEKTLLQMDVGVGYFEKKLLGDQELYKDAPFRIFVDSTHLQVVDVPIEITQIDDLTYHVFAKQKNVEIYDLVENKGVNVIPSFDLDQTVQANEIVENEFTRFVIQPVPEKTYVPERELYVVFNSLQYLTEVFQLGIEIEKVGEESNLVSIMSTGQFVEQQQEFLNTLMDVYIGYELEKKNQMGSRALSFIDRQIYNISDSLRNAEQSLEGFRSQSNIVDISKTSENLTDQLTKLEADRRELILKSGNFKYLLDNIRRNNIVAPSTSNVQDPVLNSLLVELSSLNRENVSLSIAAKPSNPRRIQLRRKIESTKRAIIDNVENMYDATQLNIRDLDQRIGQVNREIQSLPGSEKQLTKIQRKFEFIDATYKYLLERREAAFIALAYNTTNTSVVEPARMLNPYPVAPSRMLIFGLGLIVALALPFVFLTGRDLLDSRINTQEDLTLNTAIPILGTINKAENAENQLVPEMPGTLFAEAVRTIRVRLHHLIADETKRVICVTSTFPNEGKSFFAANYASMLAHGGKKTLLIDLDLRKPSQTEYFQYDNSTGLSTFFTNGDLLDDIIKPTRIHNLELLASGPAHPNPLDLLDNTTFFALLESLKDNYEFIILDTPPIGQSADYLIFKNFIDFTIYMIRHNQTELASLDTINKMYEEKVIEDVALLVNGIRAKDMKKLTLGYGYG